MYSNCVGKSVKLGSMKSIQVNLRMPLELHAEIKAAAKKRGIGVATEILRRLGYKSPGAGNPAWVAGRPQSERRRGNRYRRGMEPLQGGQGHG
jgi:hypothetical protein